MIHLIKELLPSGLELELFKNGIYYFTREGKGLFHYPLELPHQVLDLYWDYRLNEVDKDLGGAQREKIKKELFEKVDRFKNRQTIIDRPGEDGEWLLTPTFILLSLGGDDRSVLDFDTLKNKYNTSTLPDTDIKRSNCTSSSTSREAYLQLENQHFKLMAQWAQETLDIRKFHGDLHYKVFEYFVNREKHEHYLFCLTPSGTDVEYLATWLGLCRSKELYGDQGKVSVFINGAQEVGSGTAMAAQLKHFSDLTPIGKDSLKGHPIEASFDDIALESFATRDAKTDIISGQMHLKEIDLKIKSCIEKKTVPVVHYVHASKTGLSVPGFSVIRELKQTYGDQIIIIVDAAQLRLQPQAIEDYLNFDFNIIVTGSKFIGAPPFCGGLIINSTEKKTLEDTRLVLETGADQYFDSYCLPREIKRNQSVIWYNWGQSFRWKVATYEMSRIDDIPESFKDALIQRWRVEIEKILKKIPNVRVLELDDNMHLPGDESSLSLSNSIICFEVMTDWGRDLSVLKGIHHKMAQAPLCCEMGQPVQISTGGQARFALRLALGAQNIVNAYSRTEGYRFNDCLQYLIDDDLRLIEKLTRLFSELGP
jgi:hypothetical protein